MSEATEYTTREGLTRSIDVYQPQDDYTDAEVAHMDPDGEWPRCVTCGWSPNWTSEPHSVFVAENTYCSPHYVQVDNNDLID